MSQSSVQLVLHYDGSHFAGWQRQPAERTVQGVLEDALSKLCDTPVVVIGAGRTDAGVHARGQAAGAKTPVKWQAADLRRALNAILPPDIWVARAFAMRADFHPRRSAISRTYRYHIGTDQESRSPFRNRFEWRVERELDVDVLTALAALIVGNHSFRAFAVQGTAPEHDDHMCAVSRASWETVSGGIVFEIEANRFLHHMVRFLVGTMVDIASGKRPTQSIPELLQASHNHDVSPPAPALGLFLERVQYPAELYLDAVPTDQGTSELRV